MKRKYLLMPVLIFLIYACGGQSNQQANNTAGSDTKATAVKQEHKGKQLIAKSDCSACHSDKNKIVGPSYTDVANKYDNTPENHQYLTEK